jgi:hypothetical protein
MNADREALERIRTSLEDCLRQLPKTGAPAGIADQVGLALQRLNSFLEMVDSWDRPGEH